MRCSTVKISESGISQLERDNVVVTIPNEDIQQIKLSHDSRARHPFLQFFIGFVLIVTGLIMIIAAFIIAEGGVVLLQMKSLTFGVPVVPILLWSMVGAGVWLLIGVFRGRYNFLINTKKGIRKVFFEESADIREIRDFVTRAQVEFGYKIDASILDAMYF